MHVKLKEILTKRIVDISLLIGIRSDISQTDWFWENGTKAFGLPLPHANPQLCEEMTWQLGSSLNSIFLPVPCNHRRNYFTCQKQSTITH